MSNEEEPLPLRHRFVSIVEHDRDPVTGICKHCGSHNIPRQDGRPPADCRTRKLCVQCGMARTGTHAGEECPGQPP